MDMAVAVNAGAVDGIDVVAETFGAGPGTFSLCVSLDVSKSE